MIRLVLFLGCLLAVGTTAVAATLPKAEHQLLAFELHSNTIATQGLTRYEGSRPIRVRVAGDALQLGTLSITATGPGGIAMQTPLEPSADGLDAIVHLATPGTWTVALTSHLGYATHAIATIPIEVVTDDGTTVAGIGVMLLAIASIAFGLLICAQPVLRRRVSALGVRSRH